MPDAGRWFREPFGIDQSEGGFVYRLGGVQSGQANFAPKASDANNRGMLFGCPPGQRRGVPVAQTYGSIAVNPVSHRHEIVVKQHRGGGKGGGAYLRWRGCHALPAAPPQQLDNKRQPQREAASLP